jgi:outer membrane protein OmpA-like peptidoglycan-associated protein
MTKSAFSIPALALMAVLTASFAVDAAQPGVVTVNPYVMESLGSAPNPVTLIARDEQYQKPFYMKSKRRFAPQISANRELPAPPLKKPQSRIMQAGAKPDRNVRLSNLGQGKVLGGMRTNTPQSTFIFADSDSRGKFVPMTGVNNTQNFGQNVVAAAGYGYRWSDIDPRTRGAELVVTNPNEVAPHVMSQIQFDKNDIDLNAKAKSQLKDAGQKLKSTSASADLHGYASGDASDAKRTALTRILTVRDTLVAMGVPGNLLGVKPMGLATDNGPKDRVDIVVKK